MTQFFTADDGLRLAYDDRGSGHPLLCMAGLTRNMADFDPVVDHFADRARVIRLDTRGRGQSAFDPDHGNYNLIREGQDMLALMEHLGLDKVSILGTSRGGLIAMQIAFGLPDRLHGVILNDIGPVIDTRGLSDIMGYIGHQPSYKTHAEAADRLPHAMAPGFANVARDTWLAHARALWDETPDGLANRYDPQLRQALLDQATDGALPEIWPLFDALAPFPLGLIWGENSTLLNADTVAEMQRRRPDMILGKVPDRAHVPFLDEPDSLAVISAYLEAVA